MLQWIGVVVSVLVVAAAGFVVSFRTKFTPVQSAIRRMNRAVMNPVQLRSAGRAGAWASVVRHEGRLSGLMYRTPITVVETDDGFVVALPYGTRADWVRNVIAAGGAILEHEGVEIALCDPDVVGEEANRWFGASDQRQQRLFGVTDFLRLRRC